MSPKSSIINLFNSCDIKGTYKVVIEPDDVFSLEQSIFDMKAKEKKEVKIIYSPKSLSLKSKAVVKFQSDQLPTYQYLLSGISEYKLKVETVHL